MLYYLQVHSVEEQYMRENSLIQAKMSCFY